MPKLAKTLIVGLVLCLSSAGNAHSFWLDPTTHRPEADEPIKIEFKVGDIGKPAAPWGLYWERVGALRLFGPDEVVDQQTAIQITQPNAPGAATLAISKPGSHILAFASNPSFSDFEAERFNRYLSHQGLAAISADRVAKAKQNTNGTELYARRAKALFQVGDQPTENFSKPIGQTLEIVPLSNPFGFRKTGSLSVAVLWRGEPLEGATLMVAKGGGENGQENPVLTDAKGRAAFEYQPGVPYLLSVVWGEPAPNDSRADYFTIFSSLTF